MKTLSKTKQENRQLVKAPENLGQYQKVVEKPKTSVKLVTDNPGITYENTKMEGLNKSETK